jgi:hypothetical protein
MFDYYGECVVSDLWVYNVRGFTVLECSSSDVKNDINKLENLQRRGARFITKDYKSREEGSMTKMLRNLASTTVTNQETTPATAPYSIIDRTSAM